MPKQKEKENRRKEDYTVRTLSIADKKQLSVIISQQGNDEIITWLEENNEESVENTYSYGLFHKSLLIGICTIGGIDGCNEFESHPDFSHNSYLLSDVYLIPDYRGKGLTAQLLHEAIRLKRESEGFYSVYLSAICEKVATVYQNVGFSYINEDSLHMVYNNNSFIEIGRSKRQAYEDFCEFEMGFDEDCRVILSYEEFCSELNKGYGHSEYIQIARLHEDRQGVIWYDNEYVA